MTKPLTIIAKQCTVSKVQTMADNGVRASIDMPEQAVNLLSAFGEAQRQGEAFSLLLTNDPALLAAIADATK